MRAGRLLATAMLPALLCAWPIHPARAANPFAEDADPRRTPVVRVVEQVGPAVVSITGERLTPSPFAEGAEARASGGAGETGGRVLAYNRRVGSGVIIDGARAYVLTNAHVIAGVTRITARLQDGRVYEADVAGADDDLDLAVLRLALPKGAQPLPQARMGDSDHLLGGEPVVAIGNPYGLSNTVTTGVVSGTGRSVNVGGRPITGLIQTDAAINPGNSGGPLLNILGEVIGVNAAVYAHGGGLGFAIPIDRARRVLDELIATGKVTHVWLGLLCENTAPDVPDHGGLRVSRVFPGSPAATAGIRADDVLVAIDGRRLRDKTELLAVLREATSRTPLGLLLSHAGAEYQASLLPQALDREAALRLMAWRWGFTPAVGTGNGRRTGAAVGEVRADGPAARLGLKPGDRVLRVGVLPVNGEGDLLAAFSRYQLAGQLILRMERGERTYTARLLP